MRKLLMSMVMFGFTLAGCGGGDDSFQPSPITGPGPGGGAASQLTVVTSTPSIPTDGSATAIITAYARDATNNLLPNVPVQFTATSGGLSGSTGTTDASGAASVTLSTAGDSTQRTITVTATSGSLNATVNVQVAAGGGTTGVSMGSPAGTGFVAGALAIANPNLPSGGSTSVQAVLQQTDGSLYTQSATVTFSSPCVAQGLATVTSPVVTTTGIATANYVATGCSGSDVVTAQATVGGNALSANGTVTVAAGVIGSIIFESATPTNIALRGTGSSTHPETSTVVFRVLDQAGGPRIGTTVNFTLNTSVGGIQVSPASAVTGSDGRVQTVVQGGTVATSVRVTGTVQGVSPTLATQSSQLTVTTGIPDQDSFSLAVECKNVEAWDRDGVVVGVTARLSDRFNNPVPDGTAVTFQAEGGSIVSQCTTTGGVGACSVNWTSSNPRPTASPVTVPAGDVRAGRATILATAIGEESFSDTNGNGSFDNGESFVDMAERFQDMNENDSRDAFEPIYDFNNNSNYDPADGDFNGVLCLDNTGRCSANVTTGISAGNLIVMSDSEPVLSYAPAGAINITRGGSAGFTFYVEDLNGNPLPAETTVSFSVSGNGLSLGANNSFDIPCTTEPTQHPITINASATASATGTLTVTTETPSGLTISTIYPVTTSP
jgi:hypothetical protein